LLRRWARKGPHLGLEDHEALFKVQGKVKNERRVAKNFQGARRSRYLYNMATQGAIQTRHMLMGRDDQTLGLGFFRGITLVPLHRTLLYPASLKHVLYLNKKATT
jgi:hypothetical protein